MRHTGLLAATLTLLTCPYLYAADTCPDYAPGQKHVYWGDLHVHSSWSLDAWGYGTKTTPEQIYAYAKGAPLQMGTGQQVQLQRPLDFIAISDHAEWFNLMYLCTEPQFLQHPYCRTLTSKNTPATGSEVFTEYVLPTITKAEPQPTPLCDEKSQDCKQSHMTQWERVQQQANDANEPCKLTTFIAWEWSATPDYSHNHRNVIFANHNVTPDAYDYMRYPTPASLWQALEAGCQRENGCDVLAIPHNTNMGDGKSFDVETESPDHRALRARYERLVEIHQEKGNSECLPAFGGTDEDCNFERFLTRNSRPTPAAEFTQEQWDQMRGSYVRQLLMRGLASYQASGEQKLNPLQLGIIGSTDNHAGTGGFVDEETWPGTVFGLGDLDRAMIRQAWNPGGLVAVWAEENTRPAVFAALSRREVYATSGPRIRLQMQASTDALDCDHTPTTKLTPMGGTVATTTATRAKLSLRVRAQADQSPLTQVEIIKGTLADGELREEVVTIWQQTEGASDLCHTWQDPNFEPDTPAFWYARVKQTPTPRWTAWRCQRAGRCDEFEGADTWIQERAWSSPIWYLP